MAMIFRRSDITTEGERVAVVYSRRQMPFFDISIKTTGSGAALCHLWVGFSSQTETPAMSAAMPEIQ